MARRGFDCQRAHIWEMRATGAARSPCGRIFRDLSGGHLITGPGPDFCNRLQICVIRARLLPALRTVRFVGPFIPGEPEKGFVDHRYCNIPVLLVLVGCRMSDYCSPYVRIDLNPACY